MFSNIDVRIGVCVRTYTYACLEGVAAQTLSTWLHAVGHMEGKRKSKSPNTLDNKLQITLCMGYRMLELQ